LFLVAQLLSFNPPLVTLWSRNRSTIQTLFSTSLQKKDYGKVPTYLTKVKDQVKREKEHIENITQKMMHVSLVGTFCYLPPVLIGLVCFFRKVVPRRVRKAVLSLPSNVTGSFRVF
jgi:hypothetical protein